MIISLKATRIKEKIINKRGSRLLTTFVKNTCKILRKCIKNYLENMQTDFGVYRVDANSLP